MNPSINPDAAMGAGDVRLHRMLVDRACERSAECAAVYAQYAAAHRADALLYGCGTSIALKLQSRRSARAAVSLNASCAELVFGPLDLEEPRIGDEP